MSKHMQNITANININNISNTHINNNSNNSSFIDDELASGFTNFMDCEINDITEI